MIILPVPELMARCLDEIAKNGDEDTAISVVYFNLIVLDFLNVPNGESDTVAGLKIISAYPVNVDTPLDFIKEMYIGLKQLRKMVPSSVSPIFYLFTNHGILMDLKLDNYEYIPPEREAIGRIQNSLRSRRSWTGERSKVTSGIIMESLKADITDVKGMLCQL